VSFLNRTGVRSPSNVSVRQHVCRCSTSVLKAEMCPCQSSTDICHRWHVRVTCDASQPTPLHCVSAELRILFARSKYMHACVTLVVLRRGLTLDLTMPTVASCLRVAFGHTNFSAHSGRASSDHCKRCCGDHSSVDRCVSTLGEASCKSSSRQCICRRQKVHRHQKHGSLARPCGRLYRAVNTYTSYTDSMRVTAVALLAVLLPAAGE
jgi:hypothetical protein